ncbi:MAG: glycosyltransferase family 4 protein [Fimbriimonadaceae bacterium]|nr:glycosyltransferase family 4 protein [Fimbriimonadaceae bacterium]QYK54915.1 MAG: glycosyltransferase family 4 protein [Fimbriimonadaceae bacterium]
MAAGQDRRRPALRVLQFCSARRAVYGAVASMMNLSGELRLQGQDVVFGTFQGRGLETATLESGFETVSFKIRTKVDPLAVLQIASFLRRSSVDLVHTHLSTSTVNGSLAARLAKKPSVATVHGLSGKLSYLASTHLIAVSESVRDHMIQQGIDGSRVSIVPNGIPLPRIEPEWRGATRRALGIGENSLVFGTVARLTPLKGVQHALRAFRRVLDERPDIHFVIAGDGELEQNLRTLAKELEIEHQTHFLGYRNDVFPILAGMDLFVFPTLREAMGISLIEAMAVGLPTVASRTGGVPEVVTPETGVLVPPADPVSLADAILELLLNRTRMLAMSQAALDRAASEYSVQRMTTRTIDVYRAVLSTYRQAR